MTNEPIFREAKAYVWKGKYAFVKAKKAMPGAFAVIKDKVETTVVIDQSKIIDKDAIKAELNFKLITFDMLLPFGLIGFMAKISAAMAKHGASFYVIASYETDHILTKEKHLEKAKQALKELGFEVKNL